MIGVRALGVCAACAGGLVGAPASHCQRPSVTYRVTLDSASQDVRVVMRFAHAPSRVRLAMKVHPEYDARFWRFLTFDDSSVRRVDTTIWSASLPSGGGEIGYTVHVPPDPVGARNAWRTTIRADGAVLNPPDVFLYLPDFSDVPLAVAVDAPASWRVATSLRSRGSPHVLYASTAAELLDAPIVLGSLREWRFRDGPSAFVVDYWPLPNAAPFDTLALVGELRRLAHAALGIFGRLPASPYHFLLEDGANDALEHRASVTIGVPSTALARDPLALLTEIAHEFFHTWNLVAIHPDHYGDLLDRRAPPTSGLWIGEGVTMHYADVLPRRAGIADSADSRAAHLTDLLARYYAAPWAGRVSPEAASLAFGQSALANPNATGGYYLQGELLGEALDALIRDSTRDRRSLDDVMRALYAQSRGGAGFTSRGVERTVGEVCGCNPDALFRTRVRGPALIDLGPAMRRLGWRLEVDTVAALDTAGRALPDLRVSVFAADSSVTLVLPDSASAWWRAGLRTGDELASLNGAHLRTFLAFYNERQRIRTGDTVAVVVRRAGGPLTVRVVVPGYRRPRVQLVDVANPTAAQRTHRARWLMGW